MASSLAVQAPGRARRVLCNSVLFVWILCTGGCASYGTGNFSILPASEGRPALLFPPGLTHPRSLSIVLPIDWSANCSQFEILLEPREGDVRETAVISASTALTSTPRTALYIAQPERVDPRKLMKHTLKESEAGQCFADPQKGEAFRSNLVELISTLVPRTFTEDLWHNYLFFPDPNEKLVALRPGMRLRLVSSHFYSAVNLPGPREGWASAGTSSVVYDVVQRGGCTTLSKWRPTIYGTDDLLFNETDLSKVLNRNSSAPDPDFFFTNFRLINGSWDFVNPACAANAGILLLRYPTIAISQKAMAGGGMINVLGLPMIFAGESYVAAAILARSVNLVEVDGPKGQGAREALKGGCGDGRCLLLGSRALPIPEIEVTLNGVRTWVEFGTRVRDVVHNDRGSLGAVLYESVPAGSARSLTSPQPRSVELRRIAPLSRAAGVDYRSVADIADIFLAPNDEVTWQ